MVDLTSLWLPIVLSTVALFFLSFLAWTVLPHHKPDWKGLPDEARFAASLKEADIPPGDYMFPYCETSEEMKNPEYIERQKQGPNGTLQLWDGPCNMGKNLVCQFLYFLACAYCLAYLATLGLRPGADFMAVFRFVGTAGILTFTAAVVPNVIWFKTRFTGYLIDGLLYGLATAAIFAAMWPAGETALR